MASSVEQIRDDNGSETINKHVGEKNTDIELATSHSHDNGSIDVLATAVDHAGFHRKLGKRQIMMMTFGAGIGTGLWVGTGTALKYAGPGGIAVAYTISSILVFLQYMSIGEMSAYKPVHGGFIRQVADYIDPACAFAIGINFWFEWTMIIPAEVTAAISVLEFWPSTQTLSTAVYITILLPVLILSNVFPIRVYGAVEYCMSFVKIGAIIVVIFFLFLMASGAFPATHGPLVFHYWKNPGAFKNGMKGIAKAFIQAGFSFGGAEHIAIIAGEARDPRPTVKKTIKPIFFRMFSFFILNIWLVGMCVPADDTNLINGKGTLGSPFVIAIERANAMWLAHIINGFIFLTVISCGITSVYVATRALTTLSDIKLIHPVFGKKDAHGRPYVSLAITCIIGGGLCYLNCNNTASVVYTWFSALVAVSALCQWIVIYVSNIRFRSGLKAQGIEYKTLPFRAPFVPYAQYFGILIVFFIAGCEFYLAIFPFGETPSAKNFFSTYLAIPLFFFDYAVYKWYFKCKVVKPEDMDFTEAKAFDEEDRLRAETEGEKEKETLVTKLTRATKNLIFG